jgi:FkbM family methyltransferase
MFKKKIRVESAPSAAVGVMTDPNGFNVLVEARTGPMLVNRNDFYIGQCFIRYGEYSRGEIDLFERWVRPGNAVVEVGANIGSFSVEFSRMVGAEGGVLVFEPQRLVFQLLCANLALQQCTNVHAQQMALGAEHGSAKIPVVNPRATANFGGISVLGEETGDLAFEVVPLEPLDRWQMAACHFMKVDVEGMELEVLKGSQQTLARCRPVLYVENDREDRHGPLIAFLEQAGYEMYWHQPPVYSPDNFRGDPVDVMDIVSRNLLCLPRELDVPRDAQAAIKTYGNRFDGWKEA